MRLRVDQHSVDQPMRPQQSGILIHRYSRQKIVTHTESTHKLAEGQMPAGKVARLAQLDHRDLAQGQLHPQINIHSCHKIAAQSLRFATK